MSSRSAVTSEAVSAAAGAFALHGQLLSTAPYGSGHINDTFVARFDQAGTPVRYLLQRINSRVFPDSAKLMENLARVVEHARQSAGTSRESLTLVPTRGGQSSWRDASGELWRCYLFIEGARTYDLVETRTQAFEAAASFGRFQRSLLDLPGPRLHETIPGFHDCRRRVAALEAAIAADRVGRVAAAGPEIAVARANSGIADVYTPLVAAGAMPERITHNDTKFNNVMLDEVTHRAVCVIDLDTVMPGLSLYDFGDLVRTGTNSAAEDERDLSKVTVRLDLFEGLAAGFLSTAGAFLTETEVNHLAFAGLYNTYENTIRFLTDYLDGDRYYKIARPDHNLDRARSQFALLKCLQDQQGALQSIVRATRSIS